MEVILVEDVPNLGDMGDVVSVAPGYGRNFLIPQGLAMPATSGNKKQLQHQLRLIDRKREKQREEALKILGTIDGIAVTVPKRVGADDKLFGSVTNREIADVLAQEDQIIDRRQVVLPRPLNELGIYEVPIKLASGVHANVKVWVVAI